MVFIMPEILQEHFSCPDTRVRKRRGLCKSGSALSTVSAGCVFEAAIRGRGKTEPIDLNERYRMQNLYEAEPLSSLNKTLLVRQPHVELHAGNRWTAKRQR